jgi:hypothetical protein
MEHFCIDIDIGKVLNKSHTTYVERMEHFCIDIHR